MTAKDFLKIKNVTGPLVLEDIQALMEAYGDSVSVKQKRLCRKQLCEEFGDNAHNYEETIVNGTIKAPSVITKL